MFKGLCVRASTVTNSIRAFKDAVIYSAQGLLLRGNQEAALRKRWGSYLADHWSRDPKLKAELLMWFSDFLRFYFDPCSSPSPAPQKHADVIMLTSNNSRELQDALSAAFAFYKIPPLGPQELADTPNCGFPSSPPCPKTSPREPVRQPQSSSSTCWKVKELSQENPTLKTSVRPSLSIVQCF